MDLKNRKHKFKTIEGQQNENDIYFHNLKRSLDSIDESLIITDTWTNDYINKLIPIHIDNFQRVPLKFHGIPDIPRAELKLYWINILNDKRKISRSQIQNRLRPNEWFVSQWQKIVEYFEVCCIADIPYPCSGQVQPDTFFRDFS